MGFGNISFDGSTNNTTSGSTDLPSLILKYGLDPSNTIVGARNIPKLTLSPLSASVNPSKAAKASLATIKSNAWADQGNSGLAGIWNNIKNAGESALAFLDRPHQAVLNTWNDVLTGSPQNILSDIGGSLTGSKKGMTFGNILDDLGWNQNTNGGFLGSLSNGLRNTVGFAGDIATDPLTYLTFGEGSVAKTALKALTPFKDAGEASALAKGFTKGSHAFNTHVAQFTQSPSALDALHSALAKNSKSLLNFNIPTGVNKLGKEVSIINKPAFMQKTTMNINPTLAQNLAKNMASAGLSGEQRYNLMSHILGRDVTSTKDLNTQEYDYLNKVWNEHLAKNATDVHFNAANLPDSFHLANVVKPQTADDFKHFLNTYYTQFTGKALPKAVAEMSPEEITKLGNEGFQAVQKAGKATPEYQSAMDTALNGVKNDYAAKLNELNPETGLNILTPYSEKKGYSGFSPLTQKMILKKDGSLSKLGKAQAQFGSLFGSKRFTSLGSQMSNHLTANGVKHTLDAHNWAWAHSTEAINELKNTIRDTPEFKSLTPEEHKEVAYALEGQRPKSVEAPTPERQAVINKVADMTRAAITKMTQFEKENGLTYDKEIQNYFPHYYNMPHQEEFQNVISDLLNDGEAGKDSMGALYNAEGSFQKSRLKFKTMADLTDHLAENPELADRYKNVSWNPLEAVGKRTVDGMNDVAMLRAIKNIKAEGIANKLKSVPAGWHDVSHIKGLEGHVAPAELADLLNKGHKLLTSDKHLNNFFDQMDRSMNVLRKNYTVTRLGFHGRQLAGHIFHNALAGVSPASIAKAIKYYTMHDKNPDSVANLTKEMLQHGVLHTGESGADLVHSLASQLDSKLGMKGIAQKANPFGRDFALGEWGQKAGSRMDNVSRVAHYLHMKNIGMSPEAAADSVRKYLFNYGEINQTGRVMRTIFPFYQWMRNNLPLQLTNLVKNPKSYNMVQNFLKEFQGQPDQNAEMQKLGIGGMINQQVVDKLIQENHGILPKYIQDNYVKMPWKDSKGQDVYYNLALPSQDVKAAVSDPLNFFTSAMNPMLQALYEVHNNTSNLNGAPIDKFTPKGESVAMTPAGLEYLFNSALGTPAQLTTGVFNGLTNNDWANLVKAFGANTVDINNSNAINDLLYNKSDELKTRAGAIKKAVTKQMYPNGYGGGQ